MTLSSATANTPVSQHPPVDPAPRQLRHLHRLVRRPFLRHLRVGFSQTFRGAVSAREGVDSLWEGNWQVARLDIESLRLTVREGRVSWRKHVLQKLAERHMAQTDVRDVLLTGERIRDYPEDKPFPSALFMAHVGGKPIHVVASYDDSDRRVFIITAYEPSLDIFESDYRTRKKS